MVTGFVVNVENLRKGWLVVSNYTANITVNHIVNPNSWYQCYYLENTSLIPDCLRKADYYNNMDLLAGFVVLLVVLLFLFLFFQVNQGLKKKAYNEDKD